MKAHSTGHHTLLHNPTILHTKTFLRQPVTRARKYCPLQNTFQTHIWPKHFPFSLFRVMVMVMFMVMVRVRVMVRVGVGVGLGLGLGL